MATYRIGIGSEFQIKDDAVGVGKSTTGLGNLRIDGVLKASSGSSSGVSTFIRYSGFSPDQISGNITLTGEHSTTGDIVVGTGETFTLSIGATVTTGTVESVSIGTHFSPPIGDMNDRPEVPVEGKVRFNRDLNTLEFYNGVEWRQFTTSGVSGRGIFGAGTHYAPAGVDSSWIGYINIASEGNTQDFGELINTPRDPGCFSSAIRGFFLGGDPPPNGSVSDVIQYVIMASSGSAIDFGNLTNDRRSGAGLSSSTRGLLCGGYDDQASSNQNTIDYIEMSTKGDALDFGDTRMNIRAMGSASNGTRGVLAGGWGTPGNSTVHSQIDMVTISSKGNAFRFGDLKRAKTSTAGGSNTTRALFAGGYHFWDSASSDIDAITIASEGNATDFGDLSQSRMSVNNGMATNATRGVVAGGTGGYWGSGNIAVSTIESITFHSSGSAVIFGDLNIKRANLRACSDSHGGLGGY